MSANCPNCNHPVDIHCDQFCMHVNCYCNLSRTAAEARHAHNILLNQLDIAVKALRRIGNDTAKMALAEIDKIGEENFDCAEREAYRST